MISYLIYSFFLTNFFFILTFFLTNFQYSNTLFLTKNILPKITTKNPQIPGKPLVLDIGTSDEKEDAQYTSTLHHAPSLY